MKTFLVAVDLNKQKDYAALYALLMQMRAVPLQDSLWAVAEYTTAQRVFDQIRAVIDSDDSLIVSELGEFAATNLKADPTKAEALQMQLLRAFILRRVS